MLDLFSTNELSPVVKSADGIIKGLTFIENLITDLEHDELIIEIDKREWSNELKRRVQHYGYKYNYKSKSITTKMKSQPIPDWAKKVGERLYKLGIFDAIPDQLIINEYLPGQGITEHIDCEPCFAGTIVSLSLGSISVMKFTKENSNKSIEFPLLVKNAIVLKEDARYKWKHSIPARKSDVIEGLKRERNRRISLTFRNVIIS